MTINILFTKHIYSWNYLFIGSYITKNSKDDLSRFYENHVNRLIESHLLLSGWRSCPTYSLTRVYMCVRLIKKFLNIKKKGWKFLSELGQIRLIECPTYRVYLCIHISIPPSWMAKDYLEVQATSVLREQLFSITGPIISKLRNYYV